jgi:hypothetical protein
MLKLSSLFSYSCTADNYPETFLKAAIEHAVDRTDITYSRTCDTIFLRDNAQPISILLLDLVRK